MTATAVWASQPLRRTVLKALPDGRTVAVERRGGPQFSWWQSADGQCFEQQGNNVIVPLDIERPVIRKAMNASTEDGMGQYGRSGMGVVISIGEPVIPVIMMAYSDLDFLPGNDIAKVSRFLNEEGYHDEKYATGSVADYFVHCSGGMFHPRFEVVAKVTLPQDYKYYGAHKDGANDARCPEAVREAVALAESQGVDFSRYVQGDYAPLVSIIHAGPGEQEDYGDDYGDYIWAHFSNTSVSGRTALIGSFLISNETMRYFDSTNTVLEREEMTGIGTFCHEFSHALGLPDTYDVNGPVGGEGQTPGYWDIMDYQFMYDGYQPMEYCAYERSMMGWAKIEDLQPIGNGYVYSLAPIYSDSSDKATAYRIVNPENPNEYFILENRRKSTFYPPVFFGEGLLIWHILYDSARWAMNSVNINGDRQCVKVVPADGAWQPPTDINKRDANNMRYSYTGDIFPGYAEVTCFNAGMENFYSGSFAESIYDIKVTDEGDVTFSYNDLTNIFEHQLQPAATTYYDLLGRRLGAASGSGVAVSKDKKIIK